MERKRGREGDGEAHRAERREAREADLRDELLRRRLAGDVAADELAVEEVDLDERRPASAGPRLTGSEKPLEQEKKGGRTSIPSVSKPVAAWATRPMIICTMDEGQRRREEEGEGERRTLASSMRSPFSSNAIEPESSTCARRRGSWCQ